MSDVGNNRGLNLQWQSYSAEPYPVLMVGIPSMFEDILTSFRWELWELLLHKCENFEFGAFPSGDLLIQWAGGGSKEPLNVANNMGREKESASLIVS